MEILDAKETVEEDKSTQELQEAQTVKGVDLK